MFRHTGQRGKCLESPSREYKLAKSRSQAVSIAVKYSIVDGVFVVVVVVVGLRILFDFLLFRLFLQVQILHLDSAPPCSNSFNCPVSS